MSRNERRVVDMAEALEQFMVLRRAEKGDNFDAAEVQKALHEFLRQQYPDVTGVVAQAVDLEEGKGA